MSFQGVCWRLLVNFYPSCTSSLATVILKCTYCQNSAPPFGCWAMSACLQATDGTGLLQLLIPHVCCDWTPGNSGGCARHWMNGCKSSTKAWRNFHVSGALHQTYTWTVPRNVIHGSILPPGRPSFYGFLNQAGKVNSLFLTLAAVGPAPISCRGRGWAAACSRTSFCAVERDSFRTIFVLSVGMWVQFPSQVPMATMVLVIQLFLMKKQFVP